MNSQTNPACDRGAATAAPIILRELRVEARSQSNYALRLLAAGGLAVLFSLLIQEQRDLSESWSIRLFLSLHVLLLAGIWAIGPVLTAESLSRERREGTLNLLFSTRLSARAIVLGKGFVHIVRAMTLWLAALPFLTVPFLMGGVQWLDVLSALGLEFCAVLWALSAGLLASSLTKRPVWAFLLAEAFSLGLAVLFLLVLGIACRSQIISLLATGLMNVPAPTLWYDALSLYGGFRNGSGWNRIFQSSPPAVTTIWLCIVVQIVILSLLGFFAVLAAATWSIRRSWREEPPSARQVQRRRTWLTPRYWLPQFRQQRAQWLERNPLGWLHQYSAGRRASKLGWCGLILLADSLVVMNSRPWLVFEFPQFWLGLLLSLHMAFEAAQSFRREREAGVLELILVTPLSVEQLIKRQLSGFWRKFLPPVALYAGLAELIILLDLANPCSFDVRWFVIFNFVTLPVIGFYASLKFRNFAAAFALTAAFGLALPLLGPELGTGFLDRVTSLQLPWFLCRLPAPPDGAEFAIKLARSSQVAMTCGSLVLLYRRLSLREFAEYRASAREA